MFPAYQRRAETTIDDGITYDGENIDDAYETIVIRREQSGKDNAHQERYAHLRDIVNGTPCRALNCFVF